MTDPVRIQRHRTKGWRMPAGAIYVGRPSRFGNRFVADPTRAPGYEAQGGARRNIDLWYDWPVPDAQAAVDAFETMQAHIYTIEELALLRGKNLVCWCRLDQPCHADVLLRLANAPFSCDAVEAEHA